MRAFITFSPGDPPVPRNDITLTSTVLDQPGETTIWGELSFTPTEPVLKFYGNNADTILTGFEIILGNSGILVDGAAVPQILNNRIDNNYASGNGGGIRILSGANPSIVGNDIVANEAGGRGGGIFIDNATAEMCNNTILSNSAGGDGGAVWIHPSAPMEMSGNWLWGNQGASGGGIFLYADYPVTTAYNLVEQNTATSGAGGGLYFDTAVTGTSVTVELNTFQSNVAQTHGGAVYWPRKPRPTMVNNVISGNRAASTASQGGGVFIAQFGRGDLRDNTIIENNSQIGGAIAIDRKATPLIERNLIAFNTVSQQVAGVPTPWYAPGIYVNDAGPTIRNSVIHENTGGLVTTGGIHGFQVGVFGPWWSYNTITNNGGWGIFCDPVNGGVIIDFNDFFGNVSGALSPSCQIPSDPVFPRLGNLFVDPLYVDPSPSILDFRATDPDVADAGMGPFLPDGMADGSAAITITDTSSMAAITFPAGVPGQPTEVVIVARHFSQYVEAERPLTALVWYALSPEPADLSPGVEVTLPLVKPLEPGIWVELAKLNLTTGIAERTGLFGTADASGLVANVPGVTELGWLVVVSDRPPGDADEDGDVDLADYAAFVPCFMGPGMILGPECTIFDADDGDVDLIDFARFQRFFTGP